MADSAHARRTGEHHDSATRLAAGTARHVALEQRPQGPKPIQAKSIWRDGKMVEVADDDALQEGEGLIDPIHAQQMKERRDELQELRAGFVGTAGDPYAGTHRLVHQPSPKVRGHLALLRSRFDSSEIADEDHRDQVDLALSGASHSSSHNRLTYELGDDLLGRMLRNANRAGNANRVRAAFNEAPPLGNRVRPVERPDKMEEAEQAKLRFGVSRAQPPRFRVSDQSVSLMNPDQLDQTSHEIRHAYDHIHGELDLDQPQHRLASELNAFGQQDAVARELTGVPPPMFEGRTPENMAESYEGKSGYPGSLATSLEAVRRWRRGRQR